MTLPRNICGGGVTFCYVLKYGHIFAMFSNMQLSMQILMRSVSPKKLLKLSIIIVHVPLIS